MSINTLGTSSYTNVGYPHWVLRDLSTSASADYKILLYLHTPNFPVPANATISLRQFTWTVDGLVLGSLLEFFTSGCCCPIFPVGLLLPRLSSLVGTKQKNVICEASILKHDGGY